MIIVRVTIVQIFWGRVTIVQIFWWACRTCLIWPILLQDALLHSRLP